MRFFFSTGFCLLAVILAMTAQVQANSHSSRTPMHSRGLHGTLIRTKRDPAPFAADLFFEACAVQPSWLTAPWYYDNHTKQKHSCQMVVNTGIQVGECHSNSRVENNVFAAFVPKGLSDKEALNEGGVYGTCYGINCGPPAEVLLEAPVANMACMWWLDGQKTRYPLIPPNLPGRRVVPPPIVCPSNLNPCYAEPYYEKGVLAPTGKDVMNGCAVYIPRKGAGGKETFCHGVGLGCPTPTYQELVAGTNKCDISQCKENPEMKALQSYKECEWSPAAEGCSPIQGPYGNSLIKSDSSACGSNGGQGGGKGVTNPNAKGDATQSCRQCLSDWHKSPSAKCSGIAHCAKVPGAPVDIESYVLGSPDNKESVLAKYPMQPCDRAGNTGRGPTSGSTIGGSTTGSTAGGGLTGVRGAGGADGGTSVGSGTGDKGAYGSVGGGTGSKSDSNSDVNPNNKINGATNSGIDTTKTHSQTQVQGKGVVGGGQSDDQVKKKQEEEQKKEQQKKKEQQNGDGNSDGKVKKSVELTKKCDITDPGAQV